MSSFGGWLSCRRVRDLNHPRRSINIDVTGHACLHDFPKTMPHDPVSPNPTDCNVPIRVSRHIQRDASCDAHGKCAAVAAGMHTIHEDYACGSHCKAVRRQVRHRSETWRRAVGSMQPYGVDAHIRLAARVDLVSDPLKMGQHKNQEYQNFRPRPFVVRGNFP